MISIIMAWESCETSRLQRYQNKKPLQSAIWRIGKMSPANAKRMESRPQVWITCAPSVLRHWSISSVLSPFPAQKKKKNAELAESKVPFQFISFQCSLRTSITYGEWVDQNSMKKMAETGLVIYYGIFSRFRDFWRAGDLSVKELFLICF